MKRYIKEYHKALREYRKANALCSQCDSPHLPGLKMCEKHREIMNERTRTRKKSIRDWYENYKKSHPCVRCGFSDYRALQFHHTDPSQKEFTIGDAVLQGKSIRQLMTEIDKCIVLCANCHRIEHYSDKFF